MNPESLSNQLDVIWFTKILAIYRFREHNYTLLEPDPSSDDELRGGNHCLGLTSRNQMIEASFPTDQEKMVVQAEFNAWIVDDRTSSNPNADPLAQFVELLQQHSGRVIGNFIKSSESDGNQQVAGQVISQ